MFKFLSKLKAKTKLEDAGSHIVIRCELMASTSLEENGKYVIDELNFPCQYIGPSVKENIHFLKITGTKNLKSLSSIHLSPLLLGRLIMNYKNEPVATIFKFINITSIME